jgi:hypothetical protein
VAAVSGVFRPSEPFRRRDRLEALRGRGSVFGEPAVFRAL